MSEKIFKEAVTIEAALDAISVELGVPVSQIDYTVLVEPSKKLFGIGTERNAEVEGWVKGSDEVDEARAAAREILDVQVITEEEPKKEVVEEDPELTDEQLDQVADTATEILKEILLGFGVTEPNIEEYEGDDGEIILDVIGDDLAVLIGRYGRTLDSIQMLTAMATTKKLGFRYPITIDAEGYKHRKRQKLESIARSSAARAVRQGSAVRLQPMNPYDRRIIHLTLRNHKQVITQSDGSDPNRIVIVRPKR